MWSVDADFYPVEEIENLTVAIGINQEAARRVPPQTKRRPREPFGRPLVTA